jgi:hypothetical protein
MPLLLFLLGAATVALVASQARKDGGGGGRSYTLDKHLPPALRAQVLAALAGEKDPNKLFALASQCASGGYPLAAAALMQRGLELGGSMPLPPGSPGPTPRLDANLPPALRAQVLQELASERDPSKRSTRSRRACS